MHEAIFGQLVSWVVANQKQSRLNESRSERSMDVFLFENNSGGNKAGRKCSGVSSVFKTEPSALNISSCDQPEKRSMSYGAEAAKTLVPCSGIDFLFVCQFQLFMLILVLFCATDVLTTLALIPTSLILAPLFPITMPF